MASAINSINYNFLKTQMVNPANYQTLKAVQSAQTPKTSQAKTELNAQNEAELVSAVKIHANNDAQCTVGTDVIALKNRFINRLKSTGKKVIQPAKDTFQGGAKIVKGIFKGDKKTRKDGLNQLVNGLKNTPAGKVINGAIKIVKNPKKALKKLGKGIARLFKRK